MVLVRSLEQILDAGDEDDDDGDSDGEEGSSEETASAASVEDRHDAHSSGAAHAVAAQERQPAAGTSGAVPDQEAQHHLEGLGSEGAGHKDNSRAARPGRGGAASRGSAAAAAWRPGALLEVKGGGADVQGVLDALEACSGVAVVAWHAAWCETCRAAVPALERCASSACGVVLSGDAACTASCRVCLVLELAWWRDLPYALLSLAGLELLSMCQTPLLCGSGGAHMGQHRNRDRAGETQGLPL